MRSPQAVFVLAKTLIAVMALVVVACSPPGTSQPDASATVSSLASPAASASPTLPAGAAPDELRGDWRTTNGDQVVLTLQRTAYIIHRGGNVGRGNIQVARDQIVFSGSDLCEGSGTYIWAISDGVLTFTPDGDDPCGGRVEVLVDRTYEPL